MLQSQPKHTSIGNKTFNDKNMKPSSKLESNKRTTILARPKRPSSRPTTPKVYQPTATKSDKQKELHRVDIQFGRCAQMGKENIKPVRKRKTKRGLSSKSKSKTQKKTTSSAETKKKVKKNDVSLSRMMEQSRIKRRHLGTANRRSRSPKVAWEDLPSSLTEGEDIKGKILFDDKLTFLGSDTMRSITEDDEERRYSLNDGLDSLPSRDGSINDTATSILDESKDEEGVPAISASMRATSRLNELLDRFRVSAMPMDATIP